MASVAEAVELISVADYLEAEKASEVRHEYLNGLVAAMAGASRHHNTIAGNVFAALYQKLQNGACRPFMGDSKVGIQSRGEMLFYYPDILVECRTSPPEDAFYTTEPKVIVEVLSPSTERIDRREKFWAYTELASLEEYVLIDQQKAAVTVFRKTTQWQPELLSASHALHLASIDFHIPLRQIYRGIDFDAPGGSSRSAGDGFL